MIKDDRQVPSSVGLGVLVDAEGMEWCESMKLFVITGTCGAGKSTMKDLLAERLNGARFACIDSDEVGLNWWDYAGTEKESKYGEDTLRKAVKMAGDKDLVFVSCLNPLDFFQKVDAPPEIDASFFIALCPSDEEIERRLKARPAERGFTSDEIIRPHIEYNAWFRRNRSKFQLFINNTELSEEDTAEKIRNFVERR